MLRQTHNSHNIHVFFAPRTLQTCRSENAAAPSTSRSTSSVATRELGEAHNLAAVVGITVVVSISEREASWVENIRRSGGKRSPSSSVRSRTGRILQASSTVSSRQPPAEGEPL